MLPIEPERAWRKAGTNTDIDEAVPSSAERTWDESGGLAGDLLLPVEARHNRIDKGVAGDFEQSLQRTDIRVLEFARQGNVGGDSLGRMVLQELGGAADG